MDPREAYQQRDRAQLLDVREPDEWFAGHIEGSVHIPIGELAQRQAELADDRLIVAVCRSGSRSGVVADALQRAGYHAENLDGGLQAWQSDGLPLVADGEAEPRVA